MSQTVLLDKDRHDRKRFDCGVDALNNFLQLQANQQHKKDQARTYVIEDLARPNHIVGFYTLSMNKVDLSELPGKYAGRNDYVIGGLIARLGVDHRYQKQGIGGLLLVDALFRLLQASEISGFPVITVDAKDGVAEFYLKYGFQPCLNHPDSLYIPVSVIRKKMG